MFSLTGRPSRRDVITAAAAFVAVPLTAAPKIARAAGAMPEGAAFSFDVLTPG